MFSNMLSKLLALFTIKYASATAKSTINAGRSGLVWVVFLISGNEIFNFVQLIGFVLVIFGVLVYNEVIVLKFCNL